MTKFLEVIFLIVAVLWSESNGIPLFQGISFQRGFEINFKPLPRNPISFIKEKWSPFGVFGRKHVIQKRQVLDNLLVAGAQGPPIVPLSVEPVPRPAPVYERIEEPGLLQTPFLVTLPESTARPLIISSPLPPPASPVLTQGTPPRPVLISSPPSEQPNVVIIPSPPVLSSVPPPAGIQEVQIPPGRPIISDIPLLRPPAPTREGIPPISTNMVVPPGSGLFTDITRAVPVGGNVDSVQPSPGPPAVEENVGASIETNSIQPEPPRNRFTLNNSSLVRASRVALYFGSVFLQLMSQFMTNARATFDQMTNPPPVYNN
ncbi:hypothetical protein HW555_000185 [Spodoptera exigua]|uniref:Uncharacterized protein n=1 Tax=Spodoptera exigua TaxID=7107 RepID=A0A835LCF9_SPOEX|nr:hypothetical protein HW555_000185 [Spodoptera exigua]